MTSGQTGPRALTPASRGRLFECAGDITKQLDACRPLFVIWNGLAWRLVATPSTRPQGIEGVSFAPLSELAKQSTPNSWSRNVASLWLPDVAPVLLPEYAALVVSTGAANLHRIQLASV